MPAGSCDVGFNGLLDSAVGIVKHNDGIPFVVLALGEGPGGLLEDDGGSGGGVVDEGDLVDAFGIDEVLDYSPGATNPILELVEVEIVGLGEVLELPLSLGLEDRGGTAPEAAVVDAGDAGVVVGEFREDFGVGDEGKPGSFGQVGLGIAVEVVGGGVVVVVVVAAIVIGAGGLVVDLG